MLQVLLSVRPSVHSSWQLRCFNAALLGQILSLFSFKLHFKNILPGSGPRRLQEFLQVNWKTLTHALDLCVSVF